MFPPSPCFCSCRVLMSSVGEGDGPQHIAGFLCNDSRGLCLEGESTIGHMQWY